MIKIFKKEKFKLKKSLFNNSSFDYVPSKNSKDYHDYLEFCRLGGNRSGVFDISDNNTKDFVIKYSKFIRVKDVCIRDKNGHLVNYFDLKSNKNQRRK